MKNIPFRTLLVVLLVSLLALALLVHISPKAKDSLLPVLGGETIIIEESDELEEEEPTLVVINESEEEYSIQAEYSSGLPTEVTRFIETTIQEFRESALGERFVDTEYELSLDVESFDTNETESFVVSWSSYTGGANTNDYQRAFSFTSGKRLSLPDITNVERISRDLISALDREYGEEWFGPESLTIDPKNFYLPEEGVIGFAFSKYEVLPGVFGPVNIEIEDVYKPKAQTQKLIPEPSTAPVITANSFEECLAKDGMILEIFPRQCVLGQQSFIEALGKEFVRGDNIELTFVVGPEKVECGSFSRQPCLVVDGNNFYDEIKGFNFKPGVEQTILVERTLRFGTDDPTKIPMDVGMFAFELKSVVSEREIDTKEVNSCVIAGCSAQLCISAEEAEAGGGVSTCEYREEYACFATTKCEVQSTGECGWTETEDFKQCIAENTVGG